MTRLSRNAPCPCGSGRKYKKCCGKPGSLWKTYTERDAGMAFEALLQFGERPELEDAVRDAIADFWGRFATELAALGLLERTVSSPVMSRNVAYHLALDARVDGDRRLVEVFLDRRANSLPAAQRRFLEGLSRTYLSVYEVARVEPTQVHLKDLWLGGAETVAELPDATELLVPGNLIATRLLQRPDGAWSIEPNEYLFPTSVKSELLDLVDSTGEDLGIPPEDRRTPEFLREVSFVFAHLFLELLLMESGVLESRGKGHHETASLPDFLDGTDLTERVPKKKRTLAVYLGRIAASLSTARPGTELSLDIECRRRPEGFPCEGFLFGMLGEDDRISWECPSCGDSGTIEEWRGTPFDMTGRDDELAQRSFHRNAEITESDRRRLLRMPYLPGEALRLLLHEPNGFPRGTLTGWPAEYAALVAAIERALEQKHDPHLAELRRSLSCALIEAESDREEPPLTLFPEPRPQTAPPVSHAVGDDVGLVVRIELVFTRPRIWRRIELPARHSLADLHELLVRAMGWDDSHLHVFTFRNRRYGPPDPEAPYPVTDSRRVAVGSLLRRPGDSLTWEYDFGDSWTHEIRLETTTPCAPDRARVLEGARACPPEDCGGVWGYEHLLAVLADPSHPEHTELRG